MLVSAVPSLTVQVFAAEKTHAPLRFFAAVLVEESPLTPTIVPAAESATTPIPSAVSRVPAPTTVV